MSSGFRHIGDTDVHHGHVWNVVVADFEAPDGTAFRRDIVRSPGAVGVVPVVFDPEGLPSVALVRQYRPPYGRSIAAHVTFVERERAAITAVRENLRTCGFEDRATIVVGDAASHPVVAARYDLALCDPPYGFETWPELLARLDAPLVVVETDRELEVPPRFRLLRRKRYGSTVVDVLGVTEAPGGDDPPSRWRADDRGG
jgi:hypothetical protein